MAMNQRLLQSLVAQHLAEAVPASTRRGPVARAPGWLEQLQQQYPYQPGRPEMGFDPAAAQANIVPGRVERGMDVKTMVEEPVETGVGLAELAKGALQVAGAAPTIAMGSRRAQEAARRRLADNPVAMMLEGGVRELRDLVGEKGVMGALGSMANRPVDVAEMMLGVVPAGAVPRVAKAAKAAQGVQEAQAMGRAAAAELSDLVGELKISPTDIHDVSGGESYGSKWLEVGDRPKAAVDLSIVGDKVYIQHVQTAPDAQRQGYATQLIDNLIEEHPDKKIALTLMTDEGEQFFRAKYNIADDMTITPKGRGQSGKAADLARKGSVADIPSKKGETMKLYHGSNSGSIDEVSDEGLFGGVFAGDQGSAESHITTSGGVLHEIEIPEEKVLTQRAFNYDLPFEEVRGALKRVASNNYLNVDDDTLDLLYSLIIEEKNVFDFPDEGPVLKALDMASFEDLGEASWKAQRLRGEVAKDLGYQAVETSDEHGTSYLVLPGASIKPIKTSD